MTHTFTIGIVQLDGSMVNLALMKIATYHKQQGDHIYWYTPIMPTPDKLYISRLFDFTPDFQYAPDCEVVKGGTGYAGVTQLPPEIDACNPDYSLYPSADYSIQFFSRGCIRKCPFCKVPDFEGSIRPVKPMALNPQGKRIEIFDNNFFASPAWPEAIEWLKGAGKPVVFSQGIDARIFKPEHAEALNSLKHFKQIKLAWDDPKQDLRPQLQEVIRYIKPYKLMCYVLIGYWSTPEEDLYRVETLRALGIDPFVMPFDKSDKYQKRFARWVNHKAIYRTVKWEEYTG
jgi:hypothetical protein